MRGASDESAAPLLEASSEAAAEAESPELGPASVAARSASPPDVSLLVGGRGAEATEADAETGAAAGAGSGAGVAATARCGSTGGASVGTFALTITLEGAGLIARSNERPVSHASLPAAVAVATVNVTSAMM